MAEVELGTATVNFDFPEEVRLPAIASPVNRTYYPLWVTVPRVDEINYGYLILGNYFRYKGRFVKAPKLVKWFLTGTPQMISIYVPDFGLPTTEVALWIKPVPIFPARTEPSSVDLVAVIDTDDFTNGYAML